MRRLRFRPARFGFARLDKHKGRGRQNHRAHSGRERQKLASPFGRGAGGEGAVLRIGCDLLHRYISFNPEPTATVRARQPNVVANPQADAPLRVLNDYPPHSPSTAQTR